MLVRMAHTWHLTACNDLPIRQYTRLVTEPRPPSLGHQGHPTSATQPRPPSLGHPADAVLMRARACVRAQSDTGLLLMENRLKDDTAAVIDTLNDAHVTLMHASTHAHMHALNACTLM